MLSPGYSIVKVSVREGRSTGKRSSVRVTRCGSFVVIPAPSSRCFGSTQGALGCITRLSDKWIASRALATIRGVQVSYVLSGLQYSYSLRLASVRAQLSAEGANPDGNRHEALSVGTT